MTKDEAILFLIACKPLAERAIKAFPQGLPINFNFTTEDLGILQNFDMVRNDPITAGPRLFDHLLKATELSQVEVYKLDQLRRLVFKRRYLGRDVINGRKRA